MKISGLGRALQSDPSKLRGYFFRREDKIDYPGGRRASRHAKDRGRQLVLGEDDAACGLNCFDPQRAVAGHP